MLIELIMDGPFVWLFALFFASLIPIIKFNRDCTRGLVKSRNDELDDINQDTDVKSVFSQMYTIHRKYNKYDSYITYSFWSLIGMITSSALGILCQYYNLNQQYAIAPLLLFGTIFSGNSIILAWWYVKNN